MTKCKCGRAALKDSTMCGPCLMSAGHEDLPDGRYRAVEPILKSRLSQLAQTMFHSLLTIQPTPTVPETIAACLHIQQTLERVCGIDKSSLGEPVDFPTTSKTIN